MDFGLLSEAETFKDAVKELFLKNYYYDSNY